MIRLIKLNSRRALSCSWGKAVCQVLLRDGIILLFALLASLTAGFICIGSEGFSFPAPEAFIAAGVISVLFILIFVPLHAGFKAWYFDISEHGESEGISLCFLPFESFGKYIKTIYLSVSLFIKKLFFYALFSCIPACIMFYSYNYNLYSQTLRESFLSFSSFFCGAFLLVLALTGAYIYCLKYSLTYYAFFKNDLKSAGKAFKASKRASKGQKGFLFMLSLSLIVEKFFSLIPLFTLYFTPCVEEARAIGARYLLEKKEKEEEEKQKEEEKETSENI